VWTGSYEPGFNTTATAGVFRVTRIGSTLSGFFNDQLIWQTTSTSDLIGIEFILQNNNGSDDATAVTFSGFRLSRLPSGIVGWWPGDGTPNDVSGDNDNGSLIGGVSYANGKVNQAFSLDGSTGYIVVPQSGVLDVGQDAGFSVELWFKPADTGFHPLVEWEPSNWVGPHIWAAAGASGTIYTNIVDTASGSHNFQGTAAIAVNAFNHAALTYDKNSGIATLYVNGVPVAQQTVGAFTPKTASELLLGARIANTPDRGTFHGLLDEVRVYNRALTASEVVALYATGT
jgi:hypothetical protein